MTWDSEPSPAQQFLFLNYYISSGLMGWHPMPSAAAGNLTPCAEIQAMFLLSRFVCMLTVADLVSAHCEPLSVVDASVLPVKCHFISSCSIRTRRCVRAVATMRLLCRASRQLGIQARVVNIVWWLIRVVVGVVQSALTRTAAQSSRVLHRHRTTWHPLHLGTMRYVPVKVSVATGGVCACCDETMKKMQRA